MISKFIQFISRFAWLFGLALGFMCLVQFAFIAIKNEQITKLLEENTDLRATLNNTEEKIDNLIAIQSDILFNQQEIDTWFRQINKNSLAKFSNFVAHSLNKNSIQFAGLKHAANSDNNERLAKLEIHAHQARSDVSLLLNKATAIKNFMLKIPSLTPTHGYISSHFGKRFDPVRKRMAHHKGIDIAGPIGDDIAASAGGEIITARSSPSFGKYIEIKHEYGFISRYGHLNRLKVKKGQKVSQGQIIGERGNSGRSRGPHLHYEIEKDNKSLDPTQFMVVSSAPSKFF
jgi:murein DD-endopeptidase MepM/ murein hydrolase activator NlpD